MCPSFSHSFLDGWDEKLMAGTEAAMWGQEVGLFVETSQAGRKEGL